MLKYDKQNKVKVLLDQTFMSAAGKYEDRNYSVFDDPHQEGSVSPLV